MTADVRQQLTEALDEVERVARAASADAPVPWSVDLWANAGMLKDANGADLWDCEGSPRLAMQAAVATHAARWDPATVLRLVKRDRSLIADFDEVADVNLAWVKVEILHAEMVRAAAFWLGTPEATRGGVPVAEEHDFAVGVGDGSSLKRAGREPKRGRLGTPEVDHG